MDVNRLKRAEELLQKSEAAGNIIESLKNLGADKNWPTDEFNRFLDGFYKIKQDFYMKLIELKSEYDKEFDGL